MYNEETSTGTNRKMYYLKDGIAVCGDKKHCLKFYESNRTDQPQFKTGAPAQSDRAALRLRLIQASLSYIEKKKPFLDTHLVYLYMIIMKKKNKRESIHP